MPPYKHLQRYREIVGVLADEGFDNVLDVLGLRRFSPLGRVIAPRKGREPVAVRLRHTLERLGPTAVKIGQAASTRSDIFPEAIITELRRLQDDVAPFADADAFTVIEAELGAPLGELFTQFDTTPIAAASIGQVYGATLPDGSAVIVKVQRPHVRDVVETDLDILTTQARFAAGNTEIGDRYDVAVITDEFAQAVRDELDYITEGRNADRLGQMFAEDASVAFPKVYWEYTTSRVLTLERFEGIAFNRPDLLDEAGMDRKQLAQAGIYCYLDQIFTHGFFHADPHPGNLFALPDGRVAFTDFGRVGTVSKIGRDQLADLFIAIVDDDVTLAVDTLLAAAGHPGDIDVAELDREVSRLITKYTNKSLAEVEIGVMISEVLALVRNHHLMLNSELAILLATLAVLEGLGTLLNPDFDFVEVTAPFARNIINERMRPEAFARSVTQSLRRVSNLVSEIPEALVRLVRRAGQGEFRVTVRPTDFEPLISRFEEATNRLSFALVVSSFVVGLSILLSRTTLPEWFVWVARFALATALGVGSWFFLAAISARLRRR